MFNLGSMFNLGPADPVVGKKSILVKVCAAEIFKFIGDDLFHNYPRWSPEVQELECLTDGPVKLGTIARQVRVDHGQRSESKFRITIYEPSRRLAFAGVVEPYRCLYELKPQSREDLTELSFTFELLELKVFMRPFEQLVRSAIQDGAVRTVENIKRLVESGKPATAARL
ncbi:Polyketide cyclase / dehydrase and lipid transport [Nitrosospira sp. Nl5]|nr:SRPBCC family protein [Nitrosospira sp. Nl5]SCY11813.1 Polyketide cyclase / dehydrase and lipid transport [Nitrosospira sp. Nl5]